MKLYSFCSFSHFRNLLRYWLQNLYYWWKTVSEQFCNRETVFIFIFLLVLPENRKVDSVESLSWQDIYVDLSVNRVDIVLTIFSLFSLTESLLKLVFWSSKDRMCVKKQMNLYCFKNSWLTQTNLRTDWNLHQEVLTWVLAGKEDTSAHQLKKKKKCLLQTDNIKQIVR